MTKVGIVSAVRTPIGNFGGTLKTVPAYDLAPLVLNAAVQRAGIKPDQVEMVLMGQNYQSGEYVNIARVGLLASGWPVEIPGLTLDRRCPSGIDAIGLGGMMIQSGNCKIIVAGGVESMSTAEFYMTGEMRWSVGGSGDMPRGHGSLSTWSMPFYDRILRARVMSQPISRFGCVPTMMTWAETAAKEFGITREETDKWAVTSHQRACNAIKSGRFADEIVPVPVPQSKGAPVEFKQDEHPRPDCTLEVVSKLKAVLGGVCTAANSSGENDGAAAVVLMSEEKMAELAVRPLAYVRNYAFCGADPRYAYKAAVNAAKQVLSAARLKLEDMDLIEIHEAFAAQVLANFKELGLSEKDREKVNVNGSCIALGHPLGATGARIVTTLTYEMGRRNSKYGLVTICGGGGMGAAMIVERV